ANVYFSWARPPDDALEVFVVAEQWMWKMQHLGGQREINTLHVPVGRPVKLIMISQDVIHSFFVPAFRIHQDVLPGRYTTTWFTATRAGRYDLFCSQYCGTNHSVMIGEVVVMEPADYQAWLDQGADGSAATEGRKLFQKLQCLACHSGDSQAKAPLLEGLYNKQVSLQDGRTVRADASYIRKSILYPDADVVVPYQPIMPSYAGQVNEAQIVQRIVFIRSLGPGQTPPRTENAEPPTAPVKDQGKKQ